MEAHMREVTGLDPRDPDARRRVAGRLHAIAAAGRDQMSTLGGLQAAVYPEAEEDWGHWGWGDMVERIADLIDPTCHDFGGQEGTNGEGYDFACSACGFACDLCSPSYCPSCGARMVRDDEDV